jgi:hypothetical protein
MGKKMKKSDRQNYEEWKESTAEQRRWNRYPPADGVLAQMEGRTYRLLDIGGGGIAVYDYGSEKIPEETIISLHSTEDGFYLSAIRCRKVSDNRVVSYATHGPEVINRIGLQILEDDPDLEHKLTPFMRK